MSSIALLCRHTDTLRPTPGLCLLLAVATAAIPAAMWAGGTALPDAPPGMHAIAPPAPACPGHPVRPRACVPVVASHPPPATPSVMPAAGSPHHAHAPPSG